MGEVARFKYPRTPHLPFSPGAATDDEVMASDEIFWGKQVIVSIKMDGENTTVYPDGFCHARSLSSEHKPYQSWLINNVQTWAYQIPERHRVCGEYLWAKHSIYYDNLEAYFLVFSIWEDEICLSWKETVKLSKELGLVTVPVVYQGKYQTKIIKELAREAVANGQEGIVVRTTDSFPRENFAENVAKFVRPHHVQTDKNWGRQIERNDLKV